MEVKLNGNGFFRVTADYGDIDSVHPTSHTGVDLAMDCGTPLKSPANGVIERIVDYGNENIGKGIIIRTNEGEHLILGHLSDNSRVHVGQTVRTGDFIASSGTTGHSTGCHLHVGLKDSNHHFIDPHKYFNDYSIARQTPKATKDIAQSFSPDEVLHNAMSRLADTLSHMGMNLISSLHLDGLMSVLDFICSILF
ncbi:M23 family metallopeptidase [Collinsella aerofaciens]|uniref:M23 family metallopeptidase n=1 Tax=Collinsella aerofaciens TaxID=74426 RepID=UPI001D0228C3|nr:M23 family metallopeptidase [Collinsella aerofaciens]MCB5367008.1 M23 family metallopeptidase [Collinsella aerofaciens]MCB5369052.1 M23 family metallopeptidase [Collinsella aerofaciens]